MESTICSGFWGTDVKAGCDITLIRFYEPSGPVSDSLAEKLNGIFSIPVTFGPSLPLPRRGYDPLRGQYRAFELLQEACRLKEHPDSIVLGITDRDIYESSLNFVFGLASSSMRCAVISTARLSNSFYGLSEESSLFFRRVVTEAVHEIGHTLGLGHCPTPHCVMHFSNSLADTDMKGYEFCEECRRKVDVALEKCRQK